MELSFVKDQRDKTGHYGKMQMGSPDMKEAKRQVDEEDRKARKKRNETPVVNESNEVDSNEMDITDNIPDEVEMSDDLKDGDFTANIREGSSNQNRNKIENFISEVERYSISDRAAAALLNGTLKDNNIIIDGKDKNAVDKYKIRRSREAYRLKQKEKQRSKIEGTRRVWLYWCGW